MNKSIFADDYKCRLPTARYGEIWLWNVYSKWTTRLGKMIDMKCTYVCGGPYEAMKMQLESQNYKKIGWKCHEIIVEPNLT